MSSQKPKIIAHRGGRKWAPENTLAAFAKSCQAGFDGVELDIQRASTGEVVVFHDDDIGRTTNGVGLLKDISFAELRRLDAGSWFDEKFVGEQIPLLQEVFDLVDGKLTLHIEIKNAPYEYPGIEEDLLDLLNGYRHKDNVVISSFDHTVLARLNKLAPELPTAFLAEGIFVDIGAYAKRFGATHWHPSYHSLTKKAIDDAHQAGLTVNTWTPNAPREWSELVKANADGIITDDPVGLLEFLAKVKAV
jgi:glycerophosphoryl diester phosphodiesterase